MLKDMLHLVKIPVVEAEVFLGSTERRKVGEANVIYLVIQE